ncbi:MAG: tetratricopeptide repeat protein, partial [Planctomycetota bacterium]
MSTKTLLISTVLAGFMLFMAAGVCLAGTSELLEQAKTYQEKGQNEQAEAIYQQIVTGYPGSDDAMEAQTKLNLIYIATGREQEAEAAFGQLVTGFYEHTGITQAVWQVAKGYEETKNNEKALEIHQYNVQQFPPDKHAMWSQVEIIYLNIKSGENAAADAAFERLT